jgi:molecular chaperone DnaJ
VLCDEEKRSIYDRFGHDGLRRGSGGPGGGFDGFAGFGDIFENIFSSFGGGFGGFGGGFGSRPAGLRGVTIWPWMWSSPWKKPLSAWRRRSRSRP